MVLWVFGYASLVWKTGFEYDERVVGFIKGYRRAFHLACFEHRGTFELPARVPTLEEDKEAVCWGVAYCVKGSEAAKRTMEYLHTRESEYDVLSLLEFFTEYSPDKPVIPEVLVFMSTPDKVRNKYYLGIAPLDDMAMQIATAAGPSGLNSDYLFSLVEALKGIGHEDAEVIELANAVRKIINQKRNAKSHTTILSNQIFTPKPNGKGPLTQVQTAASLHSQLSTLVPITFSGHSPTSSPKLLKTRAL